MFQPKSFNHRIDISLQLTGQDESRILRPFVEHNDRFLVDITGSFFGAAVFYNKLKNELIVLFVQGRKYHIVSAAQPSDKITVAELPLSSRHTACLGLYSFWLKVTCFMQNIFVLPDSQLSEYVAKKPEPDFYVLIINSIQ